MGQGQLTVLLCMSTTRATILLALVSSWHGMASHDAQVGILSRKGGGRL